MSTAFAEVSDTHQCIVKGTPGVAESVAVPEEPLRSRRRAQGPRDASDPTVPVRDQVAYRLFGAGHIVRNDRVCPGIAEPSVSKNDVDPGGHQ